MLNKKQRFKIWSVYFLKLIDLIISECLRLLNLELMKEMDAVYDPRANEKLKQLTGPHLTRITTKPESLLTNILL